MMKIWSRYGVWLGDKRKAYAAQQAWGKASAAGCEASIGATLAVKTRGPVQTCSALSVPRLTGDSSGLHRI